VCCIMCSTSLPQSGMPSVVRCPVCRNPTHGQSTCLGADCRRCRLAPPSTGPQPTFEPPSASSITSPSVVGPSVGSAAADPQPESWSEWAERLVQEQNAIVSMHHIPVLAGLGIYDLEGRPWGQSYEFCARVQEVRAAARLASTAPLWHSLSTEAQEATACIPGSNERASETPKRMHVRPRQTIASAR